MKNMYLPPEFEPRKSRILFRDDYENAPGHVELTERLCKSLYYGRNPTTERPSLPVTEMCVEFFQEAAPRGLGKVDPFFASSVGRRACISPCSMMLGMIYIDRLKKRNSEYLKTVSSSDLFLISMMVASKYLYDEGVDEEVFNDEWADSASMDTEDVNEAEMDFLAAIDWSLFVKPTDFQEMLNRVEKRIALSHGIDRGWFSYMDLLVLSEDGALFQTLQTIMLEISKVMVVCSVAYLAGVVTLVMAPVTLAFVRSSLPPPSIHSSPYVPLINLHNQEKSAHLTPLRVENVTDDSLSGDLNANQTGAETVADTSQNSSSVDEDAERHNTRITLPGLMTLAFIKDTVNTIFKRMLGKSQGGYKFEMEDAHLKRPDWLGSAVSCSPGLCNDEHTTSSSSSACRNFSSVQDYENWCLACLNMFTSDAKTGVKKRTGQKEDFMDHCNHGFSCNNQVQFLSVFPQCCCIYSTKLWLTGSSGPILYQPFSDIALGFGTTVKPV